MNAKPNQPRKNPTARIVIGKWIMHMETRRIRVRTEREVRSSDTGDGGRGTLLRTEKHSCGMVIHEARLTHENGDSFLIRRNDQGKRTTVTRTVARRLTDIDGKPVADKPESLTLDKAAAYVGRILSLDASVVMKTILAPLPADDADQDGEILDATPSELAEVA